MKLDLSKWNPFKFFRKSPEEKRAEPARSTAMPQPAGSFSSPWPDVSRLMTADPFRIMQEWLREPLPGFGDLDRWFGDYSPSAFHPRIDVVDDGDALRVTAELPGMDRHDVEILMEDDALVLRGEKKLESRTEEKGCYRVERAFGSFQRMIPLPADIDADRAEAKFDKGILTVRIPKATTEKPSIKRLEIK